MVRQTPRNLQDVPSAYDVKPEQAPKNIYQQSALARMAEEQRQYEANKKNSSYRKILDGIQKMSSLHHDKNEQMNQTNTNMKAGGSFVKPYKSSAANAMASSFYAQESRGFTADQSADNQSASFKIRSTKKFRPNINSMRNGTYKGQIGLKPSRTNDDI